MGKGQISNSLRRLGLMEFTDLLRYYFQKYKNRKINKNFRLRNPGISLPPDYLIYESFQLNYQKFYTESIGTAIWLSDLFRKHIDLQNRKILDWGCGPGRIIRHLPGIIGNGCEYFGTDFNINSISWCSKNLAGIQFNLNSLSAQLPYHNNFMDIIYGISVLTHLSGQLHYDWYKELYRILKPGGIMLLTTQGDNFKIKLTHSEQDKYNDNKLIVRGTAKEGHRTYSAFQPGGFMRNLFSNAEILEHIETKPGSEKHLPQDIWIVRKILHSST